MRQLKELVAEREQLSQQCTVWEELVEFLSPFLDSDSAPAEKAIAYQSGMVEQRAIESVLLSIEDKLQPLRKRVEEINNYKVAEDDKQVSASKKAAAGTRKEKGNGRRTPKVRRRAGS